MKRTILIALALSSASFGQYIPPPNGGTPGGAAGGVLTGTYPNPGIAQPLVLGTSTFTTGQELQIVCSGDITSALQTAVNTAAVAAGTGNGVVRLSNGSCFSTAQLTIPTDGGSSPGPRISSITIYGAGASECMYQSTIAACVALGGTILDLRASTATGKILASGEGLFAMHDLTITDSLCGTNPFVSLTITKPNIYNNLFQGCAAKSYHNAGTPDQIAILQSTGINGYIGRNEFDRISVGVKLTKWTNGVVIEDNYWTVDTGAGASSGAIVLDDVDHSFSLFSNKVIFNNVEMSHYVHGFWVPDGNYNYFFGNEFEDNGGGTLDWINFGALSNYNSVVAGNGGDCPYFPDSTGTNYTLTNVGAGANFCNTHSGAIAITGGTTGGVGVYGNDSTGIGVKGQTASNKGVYGASSGAGTGIDGYSASGKGVNGSADTSGGYGVYGAAGQGGTGVYGTTTTGHGLEGSESGTNGIAAYLNSFGTGGIALKAFSGSTNPNSYFQQNSTGLIHQMLNNGTQVASNSAAGAFTGGWGAATEGGCARATDLVIDGSNNKKITSVTYTFVAADVGSSVTVTAGSGWTTGTYVIASVAAGAATLTLSPGAVGITGGSFVVGWDRLVHVHGTPGSTADTFRICALGASGVPAWTALY